MREEKGNRKGSEREARREKGEERRRREEKRKGKEEIEREVSHAYTVWKELINTRGKRTGRDTGRKGNKTRIRNCDRT